MQASEDDSGHGERHGVFALLVTEAIADEVAEPGDGGIGDRVVGGGALGPAGEYARVREEPEVLADVRLAHFESLNELTNIQFAVTSQNLDDAEAIRVGEDAEAFGNVFEEVGR
jgi:hypothetical protein